MNPITINFQEKSSIIHIKESLEGLLEQLKGLKTIMIIDENVNNLYPNLLPNIPKIVIEAREQNKTLETVAKIYEQLIELQADRHTFLLGIGGGIICDITGFVASTYMRGIRFGFVATTLMAQVDAAIGGKNGVNIQKNKNMVGTFSLPEFVWCDLSMLKTLPIRERNAGIVEVIKYGLIADNELLSNIDEISETTNNIETDTYKKILEICISIKTSIIQRDPLEKAERKILNFGHTLGHAIEKNSSLFNHGEAVGIGILAAMGISHQKGNISKDEITKTEQMLQRFNLPITMDRSLLKKSVESITSDKKRNGDHLDFIILSKIGKASVKSFEINELKTLLLSSI